MCFGFSAVLSGLRAGAALLLLLWATASVSAGLVHRWDLDGAAGTNLPDLAGSCHGTVCGVLQRPSDGPPPTVLPGGDIVAPERFLRFDGSMSNYVDFGCSDTLSPGHLSVAFWIRDSGYPAEDYSGRVILSKHGGQTPLSSWEFGFSSDAGDVAQLQFVSWAESGDVKIGSDSFTAADFKDGQWHHVVGTCDGAVARLYVDGDLLDTGTQTGSIIPSPDSPLRMGQRSFESIPEDAWSFHGDVGGPFLIYDYALSPQVVPTMYHLLPGDASLDGIVDETDAALLASNWQRQDDVGWTEGDFNGDGRIDDIDATILAANWQRTTAANCSVPEPSAFALLAAVAAVFIVLITR